MTTQLKACWSALATLLVSVGICSAQVFSDPVTFHFDEDDVPVWDLMGSYTVEETVIGAGGEPFPVVFGYDAIVDDRGRITGSGLTLVTIDGAFPPVAGDYTVRGKVSTAGNVTRANMTIRISGLGEFAGIWTTYTLTTTQKLEVEPEFGELLGRSRGTLNVRGVGKGKIRTDDLEIDLPPTADGSWVLLADIIPFRKLGGSAFAFFPTGRVIPMNLTGTYSPASDIASIRMSGVGPSRGVNLRVDFDAETDTVFNVRGKILGQSVRF
jgi:hypothetical protein